VEAHKRRKLTYHSSHRLSDTLGMSRNVRECIVALRLSKHKKVNLLDKTCQTLSPGQSAGWQALIKIQVNLFHVIIKAVRNGMSTGA
jgi:hypothetical protein